MMPGRSVTACATLILCLLVAACAAMNGGRGGAAHSGPQAGSSTPAGSLQSGGNTVTDYAAAILAASHRSDHEPDAAVRADLATDAGRNADACLTLDLRAAACQYGKAVATGMLARAHPTQAVSLLGAMLKNLDAAEATDPAYDSGGPSRVKALVLIRAPGWPIGPGDPDAGLAAAQRAVSVQPDYPPNVLALAEGLSKSGDAAGARQTFVRARELAQALPPTAERDDWLHDADAGLAKK